MNNYIACITARGGSKGLPNKNILDLNGLPLIAWSILFARFTNQFSRILVTTDSPEIASVSKSFGAEIPFIRSSSLSSDTSKSSDVIMDLIEKCSLHSSDYLVLFEPTSPYRTKEDFDKMISLIEDDDARKVISVSEAVSSSYVFQYFLGSKSEPPLLPVLNGDSYCSSRRQDVSSSYYLDGTFYASRVDAFIDNPTFLDSSSYPLFVDRLSSFEIDDLFDLQLYQAIFKFFGPPSWFDQNA